jgi:pyrroline-5-carboxylate reductase
MHLAIIGCGNIGLAYARTFLRYNLIKPENLFLAEKNESRREELRQLRIGEVILADDPKIINCDLIVLAVKPQDFPNLVPNLKPMLKSGKVVLSIMAGIRLSQLEEALGHPTLIRAMPNAPVEVGMGITGFCANMSVTRQQIQLVEHLLASTGRALYFDDEVLLDAVTAVSGSGPAYFYYIIDAMIRAGQQMGLSETESGLLVKQTMLGTLHLLNHTNKPLHELITAVASRGGTTEAALNCFENRGLSNILIEGIVRAEERARQLALQPVQIGDN